MSIRTEKIKEPTNGSVIYANANPSICIPRVFSNINATDIIEVFQNKLNIGQIKKVDIINNNNDPKFKKVFIHFKYWNNTDKINHIKNMLNDGKIIKVVYDNPWFWKCSLNRILSDRG